MINESFEVMLSGGHPNSLGRTVEVVDIVLMDKNKLEDLFDCYKSSDEVVRLRTSSALKRICRQKPEWFDDYIGRLLSEVSQINQPSSQWTLAQLFMLLDNRMSSSERKQAVDIVKHNLITSNDWIVLNFSIEALSIWASSDDKLCKWLKQPLSKLKKD